MSRVVGPVTFAGMSTRTYQLTAWLFLSVAVVGFGPSTMAIASGRRPAPLTVIHVHAALMVAWLLPPT
jgi:hypothetical protein